MGCYRNATILQAVLGYAPYPIEDSIAFQTFDPTKIRTRQNQPMACSTNSTATTAKPNKVLTSTIHPTPHRNLEPQAALRISPTGSNASALMAPHKEAQ